MHYLLFYEKAVDHAQREAPWQSAHLDHVLVAVDRGELILGGPLQEPTDGANVLLFRCETADAVEDFAKGDPYVVAGIVCQWQVRPWLTVVGPDAIAPLPVARSVTAS